MNIIKKIGAALKRDSAYRNTVRELQALDNRSLNDLGITREDIYALARDHAKMY